MTKDRMRKEARARLAAMPAEQRRRASQAICERVWEVEEVKRARVILLYASIQSEVDTDAIAAEAMRREIIVTYPRCLPETRAMVLHRVDGIEGLREGGTFGIREPDVLCPVLDLAGIDVAFVPGLGWDRRGTRLGRGAGYYDRLFMSPGWRGFRCGLFHAAQEFDLLPSNRYDAPLDAVVTEQQIVRFHRAAAPHHGIRR